jgi:nickel/cobalt transporter (NicO) family protein
MTDVSLQILLGTAATIGFVHTLIGVDHTLPFIVLGRARGWSLRKVLAVTTLCGLAHVMTSVLLGAIGIAAGVALESMGWLQDLRGQLAAWLLIGFGLAYATWSAVRTARSRVHAHPHAHADGTLHTHHHHHTAEHLHPHAGKSVLTVWSLFIVFALGPCEALIPLVMAPAAAQHWTWVVAVTAAFTGATLLTMLATVAIGYVGLSPLRMTRLAPHAHTLAGLAIAGSGLAIQLLGI